MTITKKDLYRKAKGTIDSIDRMRDAERRGSPSQAFGEDYNKLRSATRTLLPDLEPLLPPQVAIEKFNDGVYRSVHMYHEIHAFCSQIAEFLQE